MHVVFMVFLGLKVSKIIMGLLNFCDTEGMNQFPL